MPVDQAEFRRALGHFAEGVTVVTTIDGNTRFGITVTSFCSLALHPPLVLICINKRARIHDHLQAAGKYAVSFLSSEQEHISRRFASGSSDPFAETTINVGTLGLPLIDGASAAVECIIANQLDGGDHTIFVGQVEGTSVGADEPLVYYLGRYRSLDNSE